MFARALPRHSKSVAKASAVHLEIGRIGLTTSFAECGNASRSLSVVRRQTSFAQAKTISSAIAAASLPMPYQIRPDVRPTMRPERDLLRVL